VRTAGKGDGFVHRCSHCGGGHKFTKIGQHGSGAANYRVTKVELVPSGSWEAGS